MTTNQFFELPLGVNFTMKELHIIQSSLFTQYHEEEKKGYNACAKTTKELFEKLNEIIDKYYNI